MENVWSSCIGWNKWVINVLKSMSCFSYSEYHIKSFARFATAAVTLLSSSLFFALSKKKTAWFLLSHAHSKTSKKKIEGLQTGYNWEWTPLFFTWKHLNSVAHSTSNGCVYWPADHTPRLQPLIRYNSWKRLSVKITQLFLKHSSPHRNWEPRIQADILSPAIIKGHIG